MSDPDATPRPAHGEEMERLKRRLEELVAETCGGGEFSVGERDPLLYRFPILPAGAEDADPVTTVPEVWLQKEEWGRVRAQLRKVC